MESSPLRLTPFVLAGVAAAPLAGWSGLLSGAAWRHGGGAQWILWAVLLVGLTLPLAATELAEDTEASSGAWQGRTRLLIEANSLALALFLAALGGRLTAALLGLQGSWVTLLMAALWVLLVLASSRAMVLGLCASVGGLGLASGLGAEIAGLVQPGAFDGIALLAIPRLGPWAHPAAWHVATIAALGSAAVGLGILGQLQRPLANRPHSSSLALCLVGLGGTVLALSTVGSGAWLTTGSGPPGSDAWSTALHVLPRLASPAALGAAVAASALTTVALVLRGVRQRLHKDGAGAVWTGFLLLGGLVAMGTLSPGSPLEDALPARGDRGLLTIWLGIGWTLGVGLPLVLLARVVVMGRLAEGRRCLQGRLQALGLPTRWRPAAAAWLAWGMPLLLGGIAVLGVLTWPPSVGRAALQSPSLGIAADILGALVPSAWTLGLVIWGTARSWTREAA